MRQNKTRYAILGMLSRQDMSGYDIKKALQIGMRTFWNESNGQIYPIMKDLAAAGLAGKSVERQEGKPDRHVYAITETGRKELLDWLNSPAETPKFRLEFLLKLIFGYETTIEANIGHLEALRAQQQEQMEEFRAIEQRMPDACCDNLHAQYGLLTLRCGFRVTQALLDWAEEEIAYLSDLKAAEQRMEVNYESIDTQWLARAERHG